MNSDFFVLILSYDHPEYTIRCLNSVLDKVSKNQVGLIHNGTRKKFVIAHKKLFPEIHHIEIPENVGFTGGVNRGIDYAYDKTNSQWILLITNDCELKNLGSLPEKPSFSAPLILRKKTEKPDSIGGVFYPQTGQLIHCENQNEFYLKNRLNYIPGTSFFLHKSVWESVYKFDESLHTYWEDVDYSQRVKLKGFPLTLSSSTVLVHSVGKTCHKNKFYTSYLYQRNRKRISLKYSNNFLQKLFFLFYFSMSLIKPLYLKIKSKDREGVKFFLRALIE